MTTAIAAFLWVYDTSNATQAQWQNFWVGKSVSGYSYINFDTSEIMMNRTADEGGVTLTMPATDAHLSFFDTAIGNEYLARIRFYEMPVTSSIPSNLNNATLIAEFTGEVMGMETDLQSIEVELGAAIDAISGDIPGRKITTSLVGRLPTL